MIGAEVVIYAGGLVVLWDEWVLIGGSSIIHLHYVIECFLLRHRNKREILKTFSL